MNDDQIMFLFFDASFMFDDNEYVSID